MRWRNEKEAIPRGGDSRVRRVFAWKPTVVNDSVVWLESYEVHERFFEPSSGANGWWCETSRNTLEPFY